MRRLLCREYLRHDAARLARRGDRHEPQRRHHL